MRVESIKHLTGSTHLSLFVFQRVVLRTSISVPQNLLHSSLDHIGLYKQCQAWTQIGRSLPVLVVRLARFHTGVAISKLSCRLCSSTSPDIHNHARSTFGNLNRSCLESTQLYLCDLGIRRMCKVETPYRASAQVRDTKPSISTI